MSDQYTDVTTQGWGQRILGGFVAVLFGLALLPIGIGLLYWNEGRAVRASQALGQGAASIAEARTQSIDPALDGRLVHVSGTLMAATPARDPLFGVSQDGLLRLSRAVETYQWREDVSSHEEPSLGGTKTTVKTYSYHPAWSAAAIHSAGFAHPEGHQNPPASILPATFEGGGVTLGAYRVDPVLLAKLDPSSAVQPGPTAAAPSGFRAQDDGFYRGADPAQPTVGDVRVHFSGLPQQTVSVAAAQSQGALTAYTGRNGYVIALAEPGLVPADALFQHAEQGASRLTWILRAAGFASLLIGLICLAQPMAAFLAVVPFLGSLAETGAFLLALTVSVPLTLIVVAVAWIAHRPLLGGGLLAGALLAFVALHSAFARRPPGSRVF
jgi:hypothetical protein